MFELFMTHFVSPITNTQFTRYLEGDNSLDNHGTQTNGNNGNINFSADSQREFGKRYYSVFSSIISGFA